MADMTSPTQQGEAPGGVRCKVIRSCKECEHCHYDTTGYYECFSVRRRFDQQGKSHTPPAWCPLTIYPTLSAPAPSPAPREALLKELFSLAWAYRNAQWGDGPEYRALKEALRSALSAPSLPPVEAPQPWPGHLPMTKGEQRYLMGHPQALALLRQYHDEQQAQADSMMEEPTTGNKLRREQLYERGRSIMAEDLELWPDSLLEEFGFPASAPVQEGEKT